MGQVDASAVWHSNGNNPHKGFQQVALTHPFRMLEMDEAILKSVAEKNDGINITLAKKEAFPFYKKDEIAPGVTVGVVCNPNLEEDLVYSITKVLLENEKEVRSISPEALGLFGVDFALKGLVQKYPIHPGAIKYYKEINIWKE
ncbi:hypothetical protein SDC9_180691 [bioreactor metagenome]|uniref:Uncharacterized protein n=1 Tax=bioreactor metagenome TaxID=1076179 RepID=A0A645H2G8_9ZZZZ